MRLHIYLILFPIFVLNAFSGNAGEKPDYSVVTLKADGPGNTYERINRVLGGDAVEVPDCGHEEFGPHITEKFDDELNTNAFVFHSHVAEDNDRCKNYDRQRTEIKTYGPSPDNVKAFHGDEMVFRWKFKLDDEFQPSRNFTHLHQLKAGDGSNAGSPILTLTPRHGDPGRLEIIHTGDSRSTSLGKVETVDLALFKGTWIEATSQVTFTENGAYELELRRVSDGELLVSYSNNNIDLWRANATFVRPKWGLYRSLNDSKNLRDEKVLFADFHIGKETTQANPPGENPGN